MKRERFEYFMKHIIGESRYADMRIIDIVGAAYEFGRLDEANGYDKETRNLFDQFERRLRNTRVMELRRLRNDDTNVGKPDKIFMQEKEWEKIRTGALPERCRTCIYGDEFCHPKCDDCENGSNRIVKGETDESHSSN